MPGSTPASNSTRTLQSIVDYVSTIGYLRPVLPVGGFSTLMAIEIGNDVMSDLLAEPFAWKWNRIVVPPFYTISWQQDYAQLLSNIGWLEHGTLVDINNTALPKPIFSSPHFECVRDMERSSDTFFGRPAKCCWLPNNQLQQNPWPGAGQVYTNPLGAVTTPKNPFTNMVDANGNILILTTYGTTGGAAPSLPAQSAAGTIVNDGSCVWTCVSPAGQGFRLWPIPNQTGVVYEVDIVAQAKPVRFTALSATLGVIPDEYSKYFIDGFIAYCYRNSPNPAISAEFERKRQGWMLSLTEARRKGTKEKEDYAFVPNSNLMDQPVAMPPGPSWPYQY